MKFNKRDIRRLSNKLYSDLIRTKEGRDLLKKFYIKLLQ